jgi:hypothetical protein
MNREEFEKKRHEMIDDKLVELVRKEISELAKTYGKSHHMSIPPMVTDTDFILSEIVDRFEQLKVENDKLKMERDYCSMVAKDLLEDDFWHNVNDELPKFIEGKTYSENVFAICKELQGIQVFAFCHMMTSNVWANCYGNIDGDAEWDDNYTITHWKRISRTLPNL